MEEIRANIERIRERVARAAISVGRDPAEIGLVAVSKFQPVEKIRAAVGADLFAFGENRVQELLEKQDADAYGDVPVHMIGTLQKNKVKKLVGRVAMIESVDSYPLCKLISDCALLAGTVQDVLLEVNIGGEQSKSGFTSDGLLEALDDLGALPGVRVRGLMAIPPVMEDMVRQRKYFAKMSQLYVDISRKTYDNMGMDFLSMGMSDDFEAAICEGANIIRVGTAIFGPRG